MIRTALFCRKSDSEFYANKSKEKNGIVSIMGRVTINGFYKVVGKANDFIKVPWGVLLTTTQDIIDSFEFFDKRSDFVDYQQLMIPEGTKHTTVFTGDIPSVLTTDL